MHSNWNEKEKKERETERERKRQRERQKVREDYTLVLVSPQGVESQIPASYPGWL
jgi:hypothetical protein